MNLFFKHEGSGFQLRHRAQYIYSKSVYLRHMFLQGRRGLRLEVAPLLPALMPLDPNIVHARQMRPNVRDLPSLVVASLLRAPVVHGVDVVLVCAMLLQDLDELRCVAAALVAALVPRDADVVDIR